VHLPAPARTTDNPAACGSNVVEDVETVIGDALGDRPENSARLFSSPHHRRAHSVPVMSRRTGLRAVVVLAVAMAIVWPPVVGGPDSAVGQARAAVVAQVLHDAAAAHDEAVRADLSGDVEKAARLYRRALEVRPEQWESSLRLGTLNLRLQRTAEAESALRYTIALAEQHQRVDLCAARTNLGVLLFSASSSAAPNKQRQATGWAAEALTQYEAAASAGTCNIARLNAARLLADIAERDPPLPRDVPGVGQLSDSQEQLKTAAAVHYGAALAVAIEQDDTATADASARAYALLRPGGGEGAAGKPLPQPLSTEQHVAVGRAALVLGDREGARYHTAAAFTLNPKSHAVYTNIALMAEQRGVVPESVTAYRKAIDLARASAAETPNTGAAAASIRAAAASSNNLGNILQGVGRLREALDAYDATLELRPENAEAWNNRGVALYAEGQYDEAVQSYSHALELLPNFVQAFGGMMYVKTYTCDWQNRNADLALLQGHAARWLSGEGPQVLLPLQALVYPLPSHLLRAITELHANQLRAVHANRLLSSKSSQGAGAGSKAGAASVPAPGPIEAEMDLMDDAALEARTYREEDKEARGGRGERLRLCYCSIGFGAHPHGQLIRGVIAAHDREKVEVVVLAFSDDDGSVERHDIAHSADHFVPLHAHSDPAIAMAQWDCDVALYLDGYLLGARPELFYRTADQDETEEAAEAAAAFAVAAASSSADLAAAAAAAAAWQTRLGLGSPEGVEPEDEQAQEQGSFGDTLTAGSAGAHAPPNRKGGGVGGVQISLLYPGTLGSADFDYHVGDRIATPLELHATQFTEVALIMPYSCFPTDYTRSYAAKPYTVRPDT
jgi:tetratricopeptide (TPR) repeat protein